MCQISGGVSVRGCVENGWNREGLGREVSARDVDTNLCLWHAKSSREVQSRASFFLIIK